MVRLIFFLVLAETVHFVCCGQPVNFTDIQKLDNNVNTSCEEILPLVTFDNRTLYFVRTSCDLNTGGKYQGSDIWVSHRDEDGKGWSKANHDGEVFNDKGHNAIVGIGTRGHVVYQLNASPNRDVPGIFFSKKAGDSWTKPELIPLPFLVSRQFLGLYVSPDLRVIIISMQEAQSRGQEDLYVSVRGPDDQWSEPRSLGDKINSNSFEISPFLTDDGKGLFFASNREGGLGDADIYYSERIGSTWDNWTVPVNLGDGVNSKGFDAYFSLHDSTAYFSSSRGSRSTDIYSARIAPAVDSTKWRIENILVEARSILADVKDDTADSLDVYANSTAIYFDGNSTSLDARSVAELNRVADRMSSLGRHELKLIGYGERSTGVPSNEAIWKERVQAIGNYLRGKSIPDLVIRSDMRSGAPRAWGEEKDRLEVLF